MHCRPFLIIIIIIIIWCREAADAALAAEVATRLEQQEQMEKQRNEQRDLLLAQEIAKQEKAKIKEKKELKQVCAAKFSDPNYIFNFIRCSPFLSSLF